MTRIRGLLVAGLAVLLVMLAGPSPAPAMTPAGDAGPGATSGTRVVGYLNHVTTRLSDPEARALFASLISLGLVEAWPYTDYGPFSSGGVRLGNVNLEVMGADPAVIPMPAFATFAPATVRGLVTELDRRGIDHGRLEVQREDGRVIYASIQIDDLVGARFEIQLSAQFVPPHYGPSPIAPANAAGIVDVSAADIYVGRDRGPTLARLMAPVSLGTGMDFGEGPLVNVRSGNGFAMGALHVRVEDLAAAQAAFAGIGLPVKGSTVTVGTVELDLVAG
jgi:hypothetical protein